MVQLCSPKYGGGDAWRRYPYGDCFSKSAESNRATMERQAAMTRSLWGATSAARNQCCSSAMLLHVLRHDLIGKHSQFPSPSFFFPADES
jgi:hypothetical protein